MDSLKEEAANVDRLVLLLQTKKVAVLTDNCYIYCHIEMTGIHCFNHCFDEYFRLPPCVDHPVPEVAALVYVVSTGSPSSTSVDQDAPSPSTSQTPQASSSHVIALS
nr:hypothetical protein [Tanacetum cinerariifolium]